MRHTWQVLFVWHIQISLVPYHISDKQIGYVLTPCASKMVTTLARDRDIFPGAHNIIVSASITCIAGSVRMKARLWGGASHLGSCGTKTAFANKTARYAGQCKYSKWHGDNGFSFCSGLHCLCVLCALPFILRV